MKTSSKDPGRDEELLTPKQETAIVIFSGCLTICLSILLFLAICALISLLK